MPQMSPMNWLNLFIFFYLTFLVFNTMNYFIFNYKPKTPKKLLLKKNNWKW